MHRAGHNSDDPMVDYRLFLYININSYLIAICQKIQ